MAAIATNVPRQPVAQATDTATGTPTAPDVDPAGG